ncbi:MAG: ABC transporter permease [SAR202 cluster bacterium]|nr:ABC transporter permease [SAR202 cluster bacterium]|tara:strand:+ start:7319 stop:8479 length:1161 start_codon:yes stop_codon:yes gene_type:complete
MVLSSIGKIFSKKSSPSNSADDVNTIDLATQRQLIWRRFKRHRLGFSASIIVLLFYVAVIFADFLSTAPPVDYAAARGYMPPQPIKFFENGHFMSTCEVTGERNMETFLMEFTENCEDTQGVSFFGKGYEYKLWGIIPTNRHILGMKDETKDPNAWIHLFGTDKQGRDVYSRTMHATRVSLTIGLVGVALSIVFGIFVGAISGYYGGLIDSILQRVIEIIRSVPTIPLYMGLSSAFPEDWTINQIYFMITIIISLFAWTDLARVIRGRFLAMKDEDFVTAARLNGAKTMRIVFVHMLPSFYSHIIAQASLSLPLMIVTETSLSFLGLGLRPPAVSYGVLLKDAQNVQSVANMPWLFIPAIAVILVILALNFMGDGIRDAADPYQEV